MMHLRPIEIAVIALAVLWFGFRLWSILGRRAIRRACTKCGQTLPERAQFCPHCGEKVG